MKILFVQNIWREYFGVMALSSMLKKNGHETSLLIEKFPAKAAFLAVENKPDLVCFSFTNCEQEFVSNTTKKIKELRRDLPIVVGGVHPTLYPQLLNEMNVDFLCVGEGDEAIIDLAASLAQGENGIDIKNIWAKTEDGIIKNAVRPLIDDLDSLPNADRDLYYRYNFLKTNPVRYFFTGRGCPHGCAYCFNSRLKAVYRGKGRYVRRNSPAKCIDEIKEVLTRYSAKTVRFEDDLFVSDKKWLSEFLPKYTNEVSLPFLCYIRAGEDESVIEDLAKSGCYYVLFGVETGNEQLRKELGKKISNEQLLDTAKLLRKHGIGFFTSNMLGLPGERLEEGFETVRLNRKLGAKDVWCSVFQPYEGLPITEHAKNMGVLQQGQTKKIGHNTFADNALVQPEIQQLFNLQKFFYPIVRWPVLEPVLMRLIQGKPRKIYQFLFSFFYAWSYLQHSKVGLWRLIQEGRHWFDLFLREKKNNQNGQLSGHSS